MKKLLLVLFLSTSICMGKNYRFFNMQNIGGTRSYAMGGCFTASNYGIESMLGNPAGLTRVKSIQIMASGRSFISGSEDYEDHVKEGTAAPQATHETEVVHKFYNGAVAFPIFSEMNKKIVGVVGYRNFYDLSFKTNISTKYNIVPPRERQTIREYNGLLNVVTLGTGIQLDEKVSFGLMYNLPVNTEYRSVIEQVYPGSRRVGLYKNIETADVSGNGFFQAGVQIRPVPRLTLGAMYITSHSIEYKRRIEKKYDIENSLDDYEKQFPRYWSVGGQYNLFDNLLFTLDVKSFDWADFYNKDYYETGKTCHLGAEFVKFAKWRVGYYTSDLPMGISSSDPFEKHGVSAGLGYGYKGLTLNLAAVYRKLEYDAVIEQSLYDPVDADDQNYEMHDYLLLASCIYNF